MMQAVCGATERGEIGQMTGVSGGAKCVAIAERRHSGTQPAEGAGERGGRVRTGERHVRRVAHTVEGVVGVRGAATAVAGVGAVIDVVVIAVLRTD